MRLRWRSLSRNVPAVTVSVNLSRPTSSERSCLKMQGVCFCVRVSNWGKGGGGSEEVKGVMVVGGNGVMWGMVSPR